MTTLSFVAHKGGASKSTTTHSVADVLGNVLGYKVLLLDLDEQNSLKTLCGLKTRSRVEGGVAGILLQNLDPEKVSHQITENISLIPSGGKIIKEFDRKFNQANGAETILKERMRDYSKKFDFVLLDTPPSLSLLSPNAIHYSDYAVICGTPDILSLVAIRDMVNFIDHFKKQDESVCDVLGVAFTQCDMRRRLDNTCIQDAYSMEDNDLLLGGTVFNPIRYSTKIKTCQAKRKFLSQAFKTSSPYQEYEKLTNEILDELSKRNSDFIPLNKEQGSEVSLSQ